MMKLKSGLREQRGTMTFQIIALDPTQQLPPVSPSDRTLPSLAPAWTVRCIRGERVGWVQPVTTNMVSLGRLPDSPSTVCVPDDGTVSREHVRYWAEGDRLHIEVVSANGALKRDKNAVSPPVRLGQGQRLLLTVPDEAILQIGEKKTEFAFYQGPYTPERPQIVGGAAAAAAAPAVSPKRDPVAELTLRVPSVVDMFDRETLVAILKELNNDVDAVERQLREMTVEPTPPAQDFVPVADRAEVKVGSAYKDVNPAGGRRVLCFLDDSGSMAGANLRRAQALLRKTIPTLAGMPVKVVIFGSRSFTRVASPWESEPDWEAIIADWQGKSGRTFLWQALLEFLRIEDTKDLHLLLFTDGEDTESDPPFTGIEGLMPTVEELNAIKFAGEIHLVALGNEITAKLGQDYMDLVGATGGAGAVLNDASEDTEEEFLRKLKESEMVLGGDRGKVARAKIVKEYHADATKNKRRLIPAPAVLGLDADLEAAFKKAGHRGDAVQFASVRRRERVEQDLEEKKRQEVSPELAALLAKRKGWEKK